MTTAKCSAGNYGETLVAYLYNECDEVERRRFERHLAACPACREELAAFTAVREDLKSWNPPRPFVESAIEGDVAGDMQNSAARLPFTIGSNTTRWRRVALYAAAAALVVATTAALAPFEIDARDDGLTIRFGRPSQSSASVRSAAPLFEPPVPSSSAMTAAFQPDVSRDDLSQLEQKLLKQVAQQPKVVNASVGENELLNTVRTMIEESERRQQQQLAFRIAQVVGEVDVQRQADLQKIYQGIGWIHRRTDQEAAQTEAILKQWGALRPVSHTLPK